jgi:hypothetical protein
MARTRSRKRRPAGARQGPPVASQAGGGSAPGSTSAAPKNRRPDAGTAPKARRKPRSSPSAPTYGERPHAPWHPLPLSELLILVGAIAVVLGLRKLDTSHPEVSQGGATLFAGLGAVAIGAFEVSLREHRSGYRSHTIMLALLPVLICDSLIVLGISEFTTAPRLLSVALLAIDIVLFAFLFRLLRARFLDARHARVLREG